MFAQFLSISAWFWSKSVDHCCSNIFGFQSSRLCIVRISGSVLFKYCSSNVRIPLQCRNSNNVLGIEMNQFSRIVCSVFSSNSFIRLIVWKIKNLFIYPLFICLFENPENWKAENRNLLDQIFKNLKNRVIRSPALELDFLNKLQVLSFRSLDITAVYFCELFCSAYEVPSGNFIIGLAFRPCRRLQRAKCYSIC